MSALASSIKYVQEISQSTVKGIQIGKKKKK
jgi:hypothetical protein